MFWTSLLLKVYSTFRTSKLILQIYYYIKTYTVIIQINAGFIQPLLILIFHTCIFYVNKAFALL